MTVLRAAIRPGSYHDSIVLLQLQVSLAALPGVTDAGAVMATPENIELLRANGIGPDQVAELDGSRLRADHLIVVVRAVDEPAADSALARIDQLLAAGRDRRGAAPEPGDLDFRPRSLETAVRARPDAGWVLVSVPGRYAAEVADRALDLGRHVFLFSDNVPVAAEVALKAKARDRGLLVLGPDCGTASIGGVGLGFANRTRSGPIGIVGASGTGMQAIASRVHALGSGVSHAIGTGGRDLATEVGAITTLQAIDLLGRDPATQVLVLVSKPPANEVAEKVMRVAFDIGKPVVVALLGHRPPARALGSLHFASDLGDAADLAVALLGAPPDPGRRDALRRGGFLRGLFSGGTLALEALLALRTVVSPIHSNLGHDTATPLPDPTRSCGHTILDLGADEYTVGRPHPMLDHQLRIQRLLQEAADPEVAVLLLDLVLGDGSHPDPASELAPAIRRASRPGLEILVQVIGTDLDPQDLARQVDALEGAGAAVFRDSMQALAAVAGRTIGTEPATAPAVDLAALSPVAAINIGVAGFCDSLIGQGAQALHVEWRPPAGGDPRLRSILSRIRK